MTFSKDDLMGSYTWTSDAQSTLFTGFPSRRIFDRYVGNQLLFIINSLAALSDSFSIEDVMKIESKILNELPMNTQSEITVFNWLRSQVL
jgi:hypothetical protein